MEEGGKVSGLRELQHQISADRGQAGMDFEVTQRSGGANLEKEPQKIRKMVTTRRLKHKATRNKTNSVSAQKN